MNFKMYLMIKFNRICLILLLFFPFLGALLYFYYPLNFYYPALKIPYFFVLISFISSSSLCLYLYFSANKKKSIKLANRTLFKLKVQSLIENKATFKLCCLQITPYIEIQPYLSQQEKDKVLSTLSQHLEKALNLSQIYAIPISGKKTSQLAYIKDGIYGFALFSDNKKHSDRLLSSLLKTMALTIELESIQLHLQAKLGVSHFDKDLPNPIDADTLINQSQQALIDLKDSLAPIHYYDPAHAFHHHFMLSLANELESAIEKDQFSLYHQAQFLLETGAIYGSEALLRWHHPRFGTLSPAIFIPLAEKSGFIYKLTEWVLYKAFEQQAQILTLGVKHRLSINVSVHDISRPSFIDFFCRLAKKYQIPTALLSIELTESVHLKKLDCIQDTLKKCSKQGIKLSMDDYGTGYSSLFYLSQLPFSEIKIDKAFICSLAQDHRQQAIVKSTIDMANALNLTLIAEGVEDKKTALQLKKLGAKIAQGYYFSAPMHFEKYMRDLMSRSHRRSETQKQ